MHGQAAGPSRSVPVEGLMFSRFVWFFALATCCLFDLVSSTAANAQDGSVPIIDVHVHLVPGPQGRFEKSVDAAIRMMDRFGIATSILMSPPRKAGVRQNYDIADFQSALEKYPGRFAYLGGGGTLNPMLHSFADPAGIGPRVRFRFARQARRLIDRGAKGFGEIGGLHISLILQHGYTYVPADHPLLRLLADIAAERDVPIDLHMDAAGVARKPPPHLARLPNNPETFPETLKDLEALLSHNREAKIVWAHGGTDHLGDFSAATVARLMAKHDNLYLSLKVSGPKARTYNKLFSRGKLDPEWAALFRRLPDRFVIGSDSFYADPDGLGPTMDFSKRAAPRLQATSVFLSLLPPDIARRIARDNAIDIYKLDGRDMKTEKK